MKILETRRLILREWKLNDSADLYEYASHPDVGPNAGWKIHESELESKGIIQMFIEFQESYAIELKENKKVIGSVGLHKSSPNTDTNKKSYEIGYVLNPKFWGLGIIPEAVEEIKAYGFNVLKADEIWCGHFDFNDRSRRVNEKCYFLYQFTKEEILNQLDDKVVKTLYYKITKEDYDQK